MLRIGSNKEKGFGRLGKAERSNKKILKVGARAFEDRRDEG
jgi:hypothetical protein